MMKVTVKAPANKYTDAQTVLYWLPYSQFGETKDLFVKGQSDPWYCASNLSVGLSNWNNESKLSSSAKPAKLISLIEFHMSEDIDIGNVEVVESGSEPEQESMLTEARRLPTSLSGTSSSLGVSSSNTLFGASSSSSSPSFGVSSSSSSSSSSSGAILPPARNSPAAANTTTTLAMTSQAGDEVNKTIPSKAAKGANQTKADKRKKKVVSSSSEDDPELDDDGAEHVAKELGKAYRKNRKAKKEAKKNKVAVQDEGSGIFPATYMSRFNLDVQVTKE